MVDTAVVPYSPRCLSTTSPLGPLPNEIIYMVFEQLTHRWQQRDIARLRLVCKLFAEIGNYFLLSEVHLLFKSSQFERLRQISEHPIISKNVDSLFYEADILEDYGSMQEWKQCICVPGWMRDLSAEGLYPLPPGASERARRAYNRELDKAKHGPKITYSDTLLRKAYDAYTEHLADQGLMRTQDYKLQILKDALMKMPNLKTIEMSTECCLNNGRSTRMEEAFKDGLVSPYGDLQTDEGCGVGQLRSLLLAADAADLKLETLAVGNLDWRFFMETGKQNLKVMRKMRRALRSLRTLKLYVSTNSVNSEEDDDYMLLDHFDHSMVSKCAKYLHETSHLRDFVTATPDLERLDFNFDCRDPVPPASLCDSIGAFIWHSLRIAAFAYISADEDCLVQFFEKHASSLRKLRLDSLTLTTGSWPSLFKRARRTLRLDQAAVSGRLSSYDPEESYYFDLPTGLNGGRKAMIGDVVEKYLLKGGDGPLLRLDKLVKKHGGTYVYLDEDLWPYVDAESDEAIMDRF